MPNKPKKGGRAKSTPSRTENEWCAIRCQLNCKIGRDALEGKIKVPDGYRPIEYALYSLLHAVEELSKMKPPVARARA